MKLTLAGFFLIDLVKLATEWKENGRASMERMAQEMYQITMIRIPQTGFGQPGENYRDFPLDVVSVVRALMEVEEFPNEKVRHYWKRVYTYLKSAEWASGFKRTDDGVYRLIGQIQTTRAQQELSDKQKMTTLSEEEEKKKGEEIEKLEQRIRNIEDENKALREEKEREREEKEKLIQYNDRSEKMWNDLMGKTISYFAQSLADHYKNLDEEKKRQGILGLGSSSGSRRLTNTGKRKSKELEIECSCRPCSDKCECMCHQG